MMRLSKLSVSFAVLSIAALLGICSVTLAKGLTYRIEAESVSVKAPAAGLEWTVVDLDGASGGKVLNLPVYDLMVESESTPISFPAAGTYRIWVRYIKQSDVACTFNVVIRDEDGEALAAPYCDLVSQMPTAQPWKGPATSKHLAGPVWESFRFVAERPMEARLSFKGRIHAGGYGPRQVDCLLVTDNPGFNPSKLAITAINNITSELPKIAAASLPRGYRLSAQLPATTELFSGLKTDGQYILGLIQNGGVVLNPVAAVRLGFNRDHASGFAGTYGVKSLYSLESFGEATPDFIKAHPAPEGRFVNADGEVSAEFSYSYPPLQEELPKLIKEKFEAVRINFDTLDGWRLCAETAGRMDYSSYSQTEFRQWLQAKHGTIDALNLHWSSSYKTFDDIIPPSKFVDNKPCWLEFRDFCGWKFTDVVGRQISILDELDKKRFHRLSQNSDLDLLSPYFKNMRPMDFEQFWTEGFQGQKYACWDGYCADDFLGSEIDLVRSLDSSKKPLNQEWGVHASDARIAARSFWNFVSKGAAGMHVFQFYGDDAAPGSGEWSKWSVANQDLTPRNRLGAYSDAAQEVHRIEPLLTRAELTHAVKPVALYYSQLDLSVGEPFLSLWGHVVDEPVHVYEALRSAGYLVRWVTPKQIAAGELDEIGALVMVDCQYVPEAAAKKIVAWVESGGAVIADRWPGAWNEYAQPQDTLAKVFGVTAVDSKPAGSKMAVELSSQGYGEVTVAALNPKSLAEGVGEMFPQWDATHPVAKAMGDFFLSGMGLQRVNCIAGEVIAMSFYGTPGVVVNAHGKGKAMYVAMMLGTIYEGAATSYEWDSVHTGDAFGRLLASFLDYAGVAPSSVAHIGNPRLRGEVRVEAPLVTPEGNVLVGLMNYNSAPVGPFDLEIEMPAGARDTRMVLVSTGGSRKLTPVPAKMQGSRLKLRMPAFDTHGMIVACKDSKPILALDIQGAPRGVAGLLKVTPGVELIVKTTVYNPSDRNVDASSVELILPRGWSVDDPRESLKAIPARGSRTVIFKVRPPELNGGLRLCPILARYTGTTAVATEMVWWGKN